MWMCKVSKGEVLRDKSRRVQIMWKHEGYQLQVALRSHLYGFISRDKRKPLLLQFKCKGMTSTSLDCFHSWTSCVMKWLTQSGCMLSLGLGQGLVSGRRNLVLDKDSWCYLRNLEMNSREVKWLAKGHTHVLSALGFEPRSARWY